MKKLVIVMAGLFAANASARLTELIYHPEGDAIVIRNGDVWNNRPLYCNRRMALVWAGEMPSLNGPMGILYCGVARGETRVLLQHFAERVARYRAGRMEWEFVDPRFPGLKVRVTGTTLADANGFTARLVVEGAQPGDLAAWGLFGQNGKTLKEGAHFRLSAPVNKWEKWAFDDRENLSKTGSGSGLVAWTVLSNAPQYVAVIADGEKLGDPAKEFAAGLARVEAVGRRVVVETPDPYLNTGASVAAASILGCYVEPCFVHGGSAWRIKQPGWRMMGGATVYGWHDLVTNAVAFWDSRQVKNGTTRTNFVVSANGCQQTKDSRFCGTGFVNYDCSYPVPHYEFQTQFFDEAVREWRATGDAAFEKRLLPMLELHLQRCKECFDPDGDGLYESYNNTWPNDSIWYNGGGATEQSAYVYYGCRAAAGMQRHAGNTAAAAKYDAEADKIRAAVNRVLWLKEKGHYAMFLEQGGHRRVHEDAWIYSQHLPIEAGLATPEQGWRAMDYTEWAMERFPFSFGGEMRQTSNFVPGMWSIRELYHGDNFAMALGYFLGGVGDTGWDILRGTMLQSMYGDPTPRSGFSGEHSGGGRVNTRSPGGLSHPNCSIDFNDINVMFARAVVEGLFGYRPDYPNGIVRIEPSFPAAWDHASIHTPDFALSYRQGRYQVTLTKPAAVKFRLPVRASKVKRVLVNGQPSQYRLEPWFGYGALFVDAPPCAKTEVVIETAGQVVSHPVIEKTGDTPGLLLKKVEGDVPRYQVTKVRAVAPVTEPLKVPAGATWKTLDISGQFNGDIRTIFQQQYRSPRPATCSMRIGYDGWSAWTFVHWGIKVPEIGLQHVGLHTVPAAPIFEAVDPAAANPIDAVTLEAWITPGRMPAEGGRIIDRTTPGTYDGFLLDTWPGNSLRLLTANGQLGARDVLTPGQAVHVAGVYDPAKRVMRLYLDGREVAARTDGEFPRIKPIARPVRIGGADAAGAERFIGEIRRAAVHARALTGEQIAARAKGAAEPAAEWDWDLTKAAAGLRRINNEQSIPAATALVEGDQIRTPQGVPFAKFGAEKNIAFTSLWDNWPKSVTVPVNARGEAVWLLVCGSTNPMQGRIANAVLRFRYADGREEKLELVPPFNFWSLCRFGRVDYDHERDGFALPKEPPPQVQLGENCRAMVYGWKLRPGVALKDVTLETLSQEVVIGLMGISIVNP